MSSRATCVVSTVTVRAYRGTVPRMTASTLQGERIELRAIEPADLDELHRIVSTPEVGLLPDLLRDELSG